MPFFPNSLLVKTITLSSDDAQPLSIQDMPFYNLDVQCKTNSINIGVGGVFDFTINPGETYYTRYANLRDFMIQNATAGNNGKATIIATIPNEFVTKNLPKVF